MWCMTLMIIGIHIKSKTREGGGDVVKVVLGRRLCTNRRQRHRDRFEICAPSQALRLLELDA